MTSKPQGGYQQKFQRLPKRPDMSSKSIKIKPAGPITMNEESDYNINENVAYHASEDNLMTGGGFTAPPQMYNMSVGAPLGDANDFGADDGAGEFVQVVCRIRPLLQFELSRGDDYCIKAIDSQHLQLIKGATVKAFRFNRVVDETASQSDVFHQCNVAKLINSALEGYSTTMFAYGQTGSGKTYTIAGNEDKLSKDVYVSDESEGIIPRSVRYLWQQMAQRKENFYVKASYLEIYNEQLNDLLNTRPENLHYRWNVQDGFFVEDLSFVECSNVNDMIAVLNEGMKHRRIGSHELNKDSSRSHSILTIYIVIELNTNGQVLRKMGKLSFVDLAGSERLKESKSQGVMVKETQQINKSLFTLGKVISALSDKKNKNPYIPYRDSKLTMLLMDSLGGKSKALMISCISPSAVYYDETLNTLSYATRTMNVKNKPVIQMDDKSQSIYNLTRENELLKMENQFLREQLQRAAQGLPLEIPADYKGVGGPLQLGPLANGRRQASATRRLESATGLDKPYNKVIIEFEGEIAKLKVENDELRNSKEIAEKNYQIVLNDNHALNVKLENLENVFIGNPIQKGDSRNQQRLISDEYMASNDFVKELLSENTELKRQVNLLEEKNLELQVRLKEKSEGLNLISNNIGETMSQVNDLIRMKQANSDLQKRVEYLQKRERDLLDTLVRNSK